LRAFRTKALKGVVLLRTFLIYYKRFLKLKDFERGAQKKLDQNFFESVHKWVSRCYNDRDHEKKRVLEMPSCKNCQSESVIKRGKARGKQRYMCKGCGYHFVEGDARTNETIAAKKAMCVILYSLGKASFRMLAKIFNTSPSLIYRWIVEAGCKLPEPEVPGDIKHMEFDEMWHFVGSKKTNFGSSRPLTVAAGELWPGCSAVVILQHSDAFTTK
jgi:transposase